MLVLSTIYSRELLHCIFFGLCGKIWRVFESAEQSAQALKSSFVRSFSFWIRMYILEWTTPSIDFLDWVGSRLRREHLFVFSLLRVIPFSLSMTYASCFLDEGSYHCLLKKRKKKGKKNYWMLNPWNHGSLFSSSFWPSAKLLWSAGLEKNSHF